MVAPRRNCITWANDDLQQLAAGDVLRLYQLDALTGQDAYLTVTRTGAGLAAVVLWTSPAMAQKIREITLTRNAAGRLLSIEAKQYTEAGALKQTLTVLLSRDSAGRIEACTLTEA